MNSSVAVHDLDGLVPAASCQDAGLGSIHPFDDFYRSVMLRDLSCLSSCNVKHASRIVCSSGKYFVALLSTP
jgi:hypothetical protein